MGGCLGRLLLLVVVGFLVLVISNLPDYHPVWVVLYAIVLAVPVLYLLFAIVEYVSFGLRAEGEADAKPTSGSPNGEGSLVAGETRGREHILVLVRLARAVRLLAAIPGTIALIILVSGSDDGVSRWYALPAIAVGAALVALAGVIAGRVEMAVNSLDESAPRQAAVPSATTRDPTPDELVTQGRYAEALEACREQGLQYLRVHPRASTFPVDIDEKIAAVEALMKQPKPGA